MALLSRWPNRHESILRLTSATLMELARRIAPSRISERPAQAAGRRPVRRAQNEHAEQTDAEKHQARRLGDDSDGEDAGGTVCVRRSGRIRRKKALLPLPPETLMLLTSTENPPVPYPMSTRPPPPPPPPPSPPSPPCASRRPSSRASPSHREERFHRRCRRRRRGSCCHLCRSPGCCRRLRSDRLRRSQSHRRLRHRTLCLLYCHNFHRRSPLEARPPSHRSYYHLARLQMGQMTEGREPRLPFPPLPPKPPPPGLVK